MARDGLKIDSAPISDAKSTAQSLKNETESLLQRVQQVKSSLAWQVLAEENIDGNLQTIINNLNEQIQFMEAADKVCDAAIGEAEEGNTSLISRIAQLILVIKGILGVTVATTAATIIGGVIGGAIVGIGNLLRSSNSSVAPNTTGTGSDSTNTADTSGLIGGTQEERIANAQNEVQSRADAMQNRRPNDPTYEGECSQLTFRQLEAQGLAKYTQDGGKETWYWGSTMAKHYAEYGTTSTGAKCTGYSSFDEMLASNQEPITNVICSWNQGGDFSHKMGHSMLISRIEDGNVYFIDNRGNRTIPPMTVRGTDNDHFIPQCMSIQDFQNLYYKSTNKPNGVTVVSK